MIIHQQPTSVFPNQVDHKRKLKGLSHQITEGHQLNSIELKGICKGLIREKEIGVKQLQIVMKQASIK
jgi:hypothetical protein